MGSVLGRNKCRVVMLGLDSSGKSTVLYRLKFKQSTITKPTIGFNCEHFTLRNDKGHKIKFSVWDIGGQDKTRPLWRSYLRATDGILFVVDSFDIERMEESKIELLRLLRSKECLSLPVVVLANKQDLPHAYNASDVERMFTAGADFPPNHLYKVQATCAITGEGLHDAMNHIHDLIIKRRQISKSQRGKLK